MRQLRFVTLSEDGERLLLESPGSDEQFCLTVDPPLRTALQAEQQRAARHAAQAEPSRAAEPESPISPREIQVRVRAGESPQELAAAYGMPLDRVMRFAAAAVDERLRIKQEARRARARRTGADTTDSRLVQFGETVDERFRAHGIEADAVSWDSRRRDDGEWLVIAEWLGGDSTHSAEWLFSRVSRMVTPLDDTAADLLSDRPIRPITPPEPARPSLSVAPPLAPGVVAFPPMPDAETGPVPKIEEVFDQEAPPEGRRRVPPLVPPAAALEFDAPPLPLGIANPPPSRVTRRDESEDDRAARARIPSWDDILLGIKRRD